MSAIDNAYNLLFGAAALVLAVCILFCLIRAILGPRTANRVVAVNMIGTITISIIAMLAVYRSEAYLADISLIYAMLSFIAVIVLSKIFLGVYFEHKNREGGKK